MNMIKNIFNFLSVAAVAALLASCGGQDEIYKEWVKKGGYDYPAKAINLSSVSGYQSVIVNWEKPMDPAVMTARLFWDNYAKSIDIDYADYPDGKVSMLVGDLEDRSYTFDIVNYDDAGNQSLASEITVSPYGDGWMVSKMPSRARGLNIPLPSVLPKGKILFGAPGQNLKTAFPTNSTAAVGMWL